MGKPSVPVRVCMAEFSDVRYDARVLRSAHALSRADYAIDVHMYNASIRRSRIRRSGRIVFAEAAFAQKSRNLTGVERLRRLVRAVSILASTNLRIALSRYDIYHTHNLKYALASAFAARRSNAPLVYDAHELHYAHSDPGSAKGRMLNRVSESVERFVVKRSSVVIQASPERADAFARHYGVIRPLVIRNSAEYVDCSTRDLSMRTDLGIPVDSHVLFYSGGVYAAGGRRLDVVIEALAALPTVHLVIVGFMNDSVSESLRASARRFQVSGRVHLTAAVPPQDLVRYASGADVGIIPLVGGSLNTRLSALNKVSEYLMAGLPLACSDFPVLRAIVDNGGAGSVGEVFDVTSPPSVARAVHSILRDGRVPQYRGRALRRAALDMRWDVEEQVLLGLYSKLTTSMREADRIGGEEL